MQEEIREQVVRALHAGLDSSEIVKTLNVSRKSVYNIKNRLLSEGNVKRKPKTNDKCLIANKAFVAKVKDRIKRNSLKSMRAMVREMNVSEKTIRRVVHDHLGAKSRARKRKFFLTQRLKPLRLQKCKKLLWVFKKKNTGNSVSDEKYFTVDHVHNSRTNR